MKAETLDDIAVCKATPAGLDIYVRNPKAFDIAKVRKLISACQQNADETVRSCSEGFFEIPRD